jgi:hypothetical protein
MTGPFSHVPRRDHGDLPAGVCGCKCDIEMDDPKAVLIGRFGEGPTPISISTGSHVM